MLVPVDPELARALAALPAPPELSEWIQDIQSGRPSLKCLIAKTKALVPILADITAEDRTVPGPPGSPPVPVRIFRPRARSGTLPAFMWIHGGGYVSGSPDLDLSTTQQIARTSGCVVIAPDYRLAPEHPFPAALEDCYAVLRWLAWKRETLGIDATRIAVGGASAGGGLAAALALLTRDRAEVGLIFQLLIYPMLDDRNVAPPGEARPDTVVWSRTANHFGWRSYLGCEPGDEGISPYAAPARAQDLAGLPPAYISVGTADLFLDEDIAYGTRLMQAGVRTELHVYSGAFHDFENIAPAAEVSQRAVAERDAVLAHALKTTR